MLRDPWATEATEEWEEGRVDPGPGGRCEEEVEAGAGEEGEAGADLTRHSHTILLYKYPDTPNCIVLS